MKDVVVIAKTPSRSMRRRRARDLYARRKLARRLNALSDRLLTLPRNQG